MSQQQEAFNGGLQKPQPQELNNVHIDYAADGTAVYKPNPIYHHKINGADSSAAVMQGSSSEPLKRKRGRPRKFGPGAVVPARVAPATPAVTALPASPAAPFAFTAPAAPTASATPATPAAAAAAASGSSNPVKKGRGRPRGSGTKNPFKGSAGYSLIPHVITVEKGQDLSTRIMSLSLNGPINVCILSASGEISNASLRQPATSGGIKTYEGPFQIITLGGSLLYSEHGGQPLRCGAINVSLSQKDGTVVGGVVAGYLIAASPVQVVLVCFTSNLAKPMGNLSAPPKVATAGQSSSPSHGGTHSESSGGPGSPLNQSTGTCNNNVNNPPQGISGMPLK